MSRRFPSTEELARRLAAGERSALGRAITLVESTRSDDRDRAQRLLRRLPKVDGIRVGISGPPGVGKSTFIESLGMHLVEQGHRVAVLAVDPSSVRSGGSILADKTRMAQLSMHPGAFVRPSPSSGTLGGVGRRTRETMRLCEAAGYDVVLVETVGVGQSESTVAMLVDSFVLLLLAGAGDEVQGIKRGVLEWADVLAVTKADGDNRLPAEHAASELRSALSIFIAPTAPWKPPVLTISSREGQGIDGLWGQVLAHRVQAQEHGSFDERRGLQRSFWLRSAVQDGLQEAFERHPEVRGLQSQVESEVLQGRETPSGGARRLLQAFGIEPTD